MVAVVGRPNVGKSTLVNRILGRREAIVEELPGVTRDRKAVEAEWLGRRFTLVDTGGWSTHGDALADKVSAQAERAARTADAVLFVVDTKVGLTGDDEAVARVLRPVEAPVLLVANKADHPRHDADAWELLGLGLGDPRPVSALHGRGTGDLLDDLLERLDGHRPRCLPPRSRHAPGTARAGSGDSSGGRTEADSPDGDNLGFDAETFSVALVGRPNAGKSTLFNRLVGESLSIVHDQPGTTRDTVDTLVTTEAGVIRFVDTAGMRRRARIDSRTEYYSLLRALRALDSADVALLIVDASVGVTHQDQRLAERIDAAGCPIVILLNKWDLLLTDARRALAGAIKQRLGFLGGAPVLRVSALSGKGVTRLWPALRVAVAEYRTRIPTHLVNDALRRAQSAQPAPRGARILYATQGATDPPTFTLFVNRPLPRTYLRYVERRLRGEFGLGTTAIKLRVRRRGD